MTFHKKLKRHTVCFFHDLPYDFDQLRFFYLVQTKQRGDLLPQVGGLYEVSVLVYLRSEQVFSLEISHLVFPTGVLPARDTITRQEPSYSTTLIHRGVGWNPFEEQIHEGGA